jgi:hypothetical protein
MEYVEQSMGVDSGRRSWGSERELRHEAISVIRARVRIEVIGWLSKRETLWWRSNMESLSEKGCHCWFEKTMRQRQNRRKIEISYEMNLTLVSAKLGESCLEMNIARQ